MATPTDFNLQPVTFQQVDEIVYSNYIVNPYDLNGNVIGSQILEVTTGVSVQQVTLPLISSLSPSNYELTIVNSDGVNMINVVTSGSDTIGAYPAPFPIVNEIGATVTFSIASNGIWALQKLATKLP